MYDPQLEQLIDIALGDGELNEKEKQVLLKKADAMGVDRDELEMVLESRLANMKKAAAGNEPAQPKSQKAGAVKKCPACGAIVQSFMGACPECGYAFEDVNANLTSKELADKLQRLTAEWDAKINGFRGFSWQKTAMRKDKDEALANTIRTTPIPNSKSDLFEFMTMTQAACLSPATTYLQADAYMIKYKEAGLKARSLFAGDKLFVNLFNAEPQLLSDYQRVHMNQPQEGDSTNPVVKIILGVLIGFISFILLMFLAAICV